MSRLSELMERCACGVSVEVNEHRNDYETAAEWFARRRPGDLTEVTPEVRAEMIRLNRIVYVHAYPTTPIGFFAALHHDLEAACAEVLAGMDAEGR